MHASPARALGFRPKPDAVDAVANLFRTRDSAIGPTPAPHPLAMLPLTQSRPATRCSGVDIRRLILSSAKRAGVGHIGSALSIADIVDVLLRDVLRGVGGDAADRDVLVLSKGHAALAYYCALRLQGLLSEEDLATYCQNGSLLGVHPDHRLASVDFSTGSLGHGLALGVGAALGIRLGARGARVFAVISDAELNEGSTWEAIMFAGHHQLGNLTAILDDNGQQALGKTVDVIRIDSVLEKLASFGWDALSVDGHDQEALLAAFAAPGNGLPRFIRARTVSGSGVPFMEGQVAWHYLPMSDEQYRTALAAVGEPGA
jgi:transketolase